MIEVIIVIVVLGLIAVVAYLIYRRWIKARPDRAIAMRNSLVNRNYFFQKPSGQSAGDPYRYNNASNQIYTSTTVPFHEDFDEDSLDRRRIADEEARKRHQEIHNSWALAQGSGEGEGSFNSSTETHNLLSTTQDEDQLTPAFADFSTKTTSETTEQLSTTSGSKTAAGPDNTFA